jgi:putative NIF3 family GTP cyclohydrolase 1 type 2
MKSLSIVLIIIICLTAHVKAQSRGNEKPLLVSSGHTAEQIIAEILQNTGNAPIPNTVDIIKEGDPQTKVTGIITCMFATMEVLKDAVARKCNLIIVHEPLYYNHLDQTENFRNDPVYIEKSKFIKDNKLVIWRFHDNIHVMNPDGIETGMVDKLGWKKYLVKGTTNEFVFPETTLQELLINLKKIFPENAFYVIGKPDMKFTSVILAAGAPGSARHIKLLEDKNTQVVLAGEAPQWETYEYMRDAVSQGRNKAIVFLGHINSEEAGMDYCATWLKTFIKDLPVNFVESGSSFWTY